MYTKPDMTKPEDALAHALSEIMNDSAPMGWERYRFPASCLLAIFEMTAKPTHVCFSTYGGTFPPKAQP